MLVYHLLHVRYALSFIRLPVTAETPSVPNNLIVPVCRKASFLHDSRCSVRNSEGIFPDLLLIPVLHPHRLAVILRNRLLSSSTSYPVYQRICLFSILSLL